MNTVNKAKMVPMGSQSLADVLNKLKAEGYTLDLNTKDSLKTYYADGQHYTGFKIDKIVRMDVMTDPDDQSVVYAISSQDDNIKGILINSYGMYSDEKIDKIIDHIDRPIDRDRHKADDLH